MVVSQRFLSTLQSTVKAGERQYRIALRASVHPSILSRIRNDGIKLKRGDRRVIAVGRELGLEPDECFAAEDGQ